MSRHQDVQEAGPILVSQELTLRHSVQLALLHPEDNDEALARPVLLCKGV